MLIFMLCKDFCHRNRKNETNITINLQSLIMPSSNHMIVYAQIRSFQYIFCLKMLFI